MVFTKKLQAATYVATDSFWGRMGDKGGKDVKVTKGQVVDANDPLVKAFPAMFAPQEYERFAPPVVEQATAAPGEKR